MAHSYINSIFHCVFSTKDRSSEIQTPTALWAYLQGIARNLGIHARAIGGTKDHVHLLFDLPSKMAVAEAIGKFKANSSRWLKTQHPWNGWQEGYAASSVSASVVEDVERYIRDQERHHAKRDFREELRILLEKSGVRYDANDL